MSFFNIGSKPKSHKEVEEEFVNLTNKISGLNIKIQELESEHLNAEREWGRLYNKLNENNSPEWHKHYDSLVTEAKKNKETLKQELQTLEQELQTLKQQRQRLEPQLQRLSRSTRAAEAEAMAEEEAAARAAEAAAVVIRSTKVDPSNITRYVRVKDASNITRLGGFSKKKRFNTRKLRRGSRQKTKNRKIKKRKTKRNY